jgi:hypothetical protein
MPPKGSEIAAKSQQGYIFPEGATQFTELQLQKKSIPSKLADVHQT